MPLATGLRSHLPHLLGWRRSLVLGFVSSGGGILVLSFRKLRQRHDEIFEDGFLSNFLC